MNEFKDQLDATEKDKVTKLITELREIAAKGQAGDGAVTADAIREKINDTQQASLGLFQKVRMTCLPFHIVLTAFSEGLREEER
jgi:molecular chaperone DnaK